MITEAQRAKLEGMARVDQNANEQWKALMYALGVIVARAKPFFTADDVFDLYRNKGYLVSTHELRAFGPIMMRLAKDGFCQKENVAPRPSNRKSLHASPRAVWKSLVYEGKANGQI